MSWTLGKPGRNVVILLLLISSILTSYGQEELRFRHLGEEDGLVDNRYNSFVTKDSRGFVWISSMQGCYRFDGVNLKHYDINLEKNYSQNIQSRFFESKSKKLWFTTVDGVHCYDPNTDQIKSRKIKKGDSFIESVYHAFFYDLKTDIIWLSNGEYMWAYDTERNLNTTEYLPSLGHRFRVDTLPTGEMKSIFAFPWIVKNGFEIWTISDNGSWVKEYFDEGLLSTTEISDGVLENDSTLWLISNKGLINFDLKSKNIRDVYTPNKAITFHFWGGLFFKDELILLSTTNDGLWSFNTLKKKFEQHWKNIDSNNNVISSNNPRDLYISKDNQLWITYPSIGLDYTTLPPFSFSNPLSKFGSDIGLKKGFIIQDSYNQVWALTESQGIFVFNLNGKLLKQFLQIENNPAFLFHHMSIDRNGHIWLLLENEIYMYGATKKLSNEGWIRIRSDTISFESIYHNIEGKTIVISPSGVFELLKKKSDFQLKKLKNFESFTSYEFDYWYPLNNNTTLAPYNNNHLWLLEIINSEVKVKDSLFFEGQVFDIFYEKNNPELAWLGTDKGLFKLHHKNKQKPFLEKEDLGLNVCINAIEIDSTGLIWLSTNDGLLSYELSNKLITNFTKIDGLSSNISTNQSRLFASDGKIWFGNNKGLSVFDPNKIFTPPSTSSTYIEALLINQQPFQPDSLVINSVDQLSLKYFQNTIELDLRSVDIEPTSQTRIQYKLTNYENQWSTLKPGGFARFTKVPPGQYVLEARTIDEHNQKGPTKNLRITIDTPFWETWWFRISSFLVLLLMILGSVRLFFIRKIKIQHQLLEKQIMINKERDRIAKELHDEVGGSLSSILFLSDDVVFDIKEAGKLEQIRKISKLSKTALTNMKDIIWALDNEQSTLSDLIIRLQNFSSEFLTNHEISLSTQSNIDSKSELTISSEIKRNILLIVKESLNNTVKYADASLVLLVFKLEGTTFQIIIKDNGKGFELASNMNKGTGLNSMAKRSNLMKGNLEIKSSKLAGTKVSLSVEL